MTPKFSIWKVGRFGESTKLSAKHKFDGGQKAWIYYCFAYFLYTLLATGFYSVFSNISIYQIHFSKPKIFKVTIKPF